MQPASSSTPVRPSPADERAQEEAALWFARMRGERVAEVQRARFAAWLAADEIHRQEYEVLERIWDQSRQLVPTAKAKVAPSRGRLARNAGGLIGVVLLCVWLGIAWFDGQIATAPGERQHIRLTDGSELDVAPRTRLRIKFDASQRRLELDKGRIVVKVAADPQRPFEVITGGGIIRDIGTRFEVDAREDSARVAVAEGIVEIVVPANGKGAFRRLQAGEAADLDGKAISPTQPVDTDAALAWTKGQLVFDAAPLAEVISTLNRYRKTPIDLDAPMLAGVRVSGVFLLDDEAGALRALELIAPIRFMPTAGRVVAQPVKPVKSGES